MICAFAREGDFARALGLFRAMDLEGARPDRVTFVAILDACGQSLAMELGMWIHAELLAAGFQGEITISTALVEMYGRLGKIEDARRAFDRATGIDGAGGDAVLWAAMLAAYAINHSPSQAREFFENTPPRRRSSVSWTTMVTAYARAGDLHAARQLFDQIPRKNNNVVAWNSIITAYAQSGHRRREALDLFRAMDLEGIAPDSVTFTAIIDSCSGVAEGRIVHSILTDEGRGWIAHFAIQTALVAMYGNFGHLREAKLVFDDLKHRDVKAWSSMLAAFALNGHSHEALEIFHAMQLHGFTPNSVTFVSVLLACAHAGLLSDVYSHFASLSADYAIAASLDHYMCVVDALARSGRLREAEDLIATMPYEPDAVAWTSLLSASTAAGDSHRAGKAAEYVYELDPTNAAPYTLLSGLHLGPARNAASSSSSSSSYSSSRLSDHVTKTEDDSSCLSTLNFCQF
ncbi:pentatricopeptide repeat-containing protein At3g29230-like [Selaginella moellendorffii]|uniref:pentatricopeptide repeat-containing protein At3g29230-like n=1 Tax=Selaginella moellendorffii TaxID=88036 RepID=UPI000D1CA134|nr:pentatricopeptide repeat-containing protein At3g29230-like [Selaginella moellendorffii]|eukprot:XP_024521480.1 pentatricopeptide repeat-containing protein At3g29230-like [Selaginella moellendorffii]